ncbi:hypothetical protein H4CHR_01854 [Variovorax sp. PBS-H4]|nr:hypothetical protein H4CHR_01854 [Variovorax sp. PBS-H4]
MLELTAVLVRSRLFDGKPAPEPLFCNGQLGESLQICVRRADPVAT